MLIKMRVKKRKKRVKNLLVCYLSFYKYPPIIIYRKRYVFMIKNIGFFVFISLVVSGKINAQLQKTYFISPGIKLGYTFKAGISYGATLDIGVHDRSNSIVDNLKYGISLNYTFIKVKKYTHRLRSINLMAQNDFATLKLGLGKVKNPWGFGKRNKCRVPGINMDINFAFPNKYSPWIGFSLFKYKNADWAWFNKPYQTLYINYKYDVMSPIYNVQEQSGILK